MNLIIPTVSLITIRLRSLSVLHFIWTLGILCVKWFILKTTRTVATEDKSLSPFHLLLPILTITSSPFWIFFPFLSHRSISFSLPFLYLFSYFPFLQSSFDSFLFILIFTFSFLYSVFFLFLFFTFPFASLLPLLSLCLIPFSFTLSSPFYLLFPLFGRLSIPFSSSFLSSFFPLLKPFPYMNLLSYVLTYVFFTFKISVEINLSFHNF